MTNLTKAQQETIQELMQELADEIYEKSGWAEANLKQFIEGGTVQIQHFPNGEIKARHIPVINTYSHYGSGWDKS